MSTDMQKQLDLLYKRMAALEARMDMIQKGESSSPPPSPSPSSRDVWFLSKKMEAMEKEAQIIKDKHSSDVAFGVQWDSPEYREQYFKLKREIRELNRQIAAL